MRVPALETVRFGGRFTPEPVSTTTWAMRSDARYVFPAGGGLYPRICRSSRNMRGRVGLAPSTRSVTLSGAAGPAGGSRGAREGGEDEWDARLRHGASPCRERPSRRACRGVRGGLVQVTA